MENPVIAVQGIGQSIWYDNIRRGLLTSGELKELVDQVGVLGVISNPAIFEKAHPRQEKRHSTGISWASRAGGSPPAFTPRWAFTSPAGR